MNLMDWSPQLILIVVLGVMVLTEFFVIVIVVACYMRGKIVERKKKKNTKDNDHWPKVNPDYVPQVRQSYHDPMYVDQPEFWLVPSQYARPTVHPPPAYATIPLRQKPYVYPPPVPVRRSVVV